MGRRGSARGSLGNGRGRGRGPRTSRLLPGTPRILSASDAGALSGAGKFGGFAGGDSVGGVARIWGVQGHGISSLSKHFETWRRGICSLGHIWPEGDSRIVTGDISMTDHDFWGLLAAGYVLGSIPFGYL